MVDKETIARTYADERAEMARDVIATNRYFAVATIQPDGSPRVSPVFYNHHGHRAFYWVSSPGAQHSHNLAADPRVNAVVFDSSVPPPETRAVYLTGSAYEVAPADLETEIPRAFAPSEPKGGRAFSAQELSGEGDLRLYRLEVTSAEVHARGRHPQWGLGIDTRLPVTL
jgi:nitroimidazol reductase NimA-like FMN-containing flavoprotein (pyridoxamine 5'-phosphate oxidase superfamily)